MSNHDIFLKYNEETEQFETKRLKATFYDRDEKRIKYDDSEKYWREFVLRWWHHHSLQFEPLVPTDEQVERLENVNQAQIPAEYLHEVSEYVEHGLIEPETSTPYLVDLADQPNVVEARIEHYRNRLRDELAAVRFNHEVGGVTAPNGVMIHTTREAQSQLSAAYATLKEGLRQKVDWKSPNGWIEVTLEHLQPIAAFASAHVQICFSAECNVDQYEISTAPDVESLMEIDIKEAFFDTYATLMAEVIDEVDSEE